MNDDSERAVRLSRREISDAVSGWGWRLVLGVLCTSVAVRSLAQAARTTTAVVEACGADLDERLTIDVRRDRVVLALQAPGTGWVSRREIDLAGRLSSIVRDLRLRTDASLGPGTPRALQRLEIAIDALDIPRIRPFWKAVLAYADAAGESGPAAALVDPIGQAPAVWFQQMDAPRPQRNRIHLDISVPHDEAERGVRAAVAAGGRVVSDADAPAFWVLADAEDNEACVSTWQGRDA